MTKTFGEGKGEDMMWETVKLVSDAMEKSMDGEAKHRLMKKIYAKMTGGHYDKDFAIQDTAKMYYKDEDGKKHAAPYWTEEQVREIYDEMKQLVPKYNFWDFYVVLNMVKSDYCRLIEQWFPESSPEERNERVVDLAVNWLQDEDNPYGESKVWGYLNPSRE